MFVWRYLDERSETVGASGPFTDRTGAEDWLGANWSELRDAGVAEVELIDEASPGRPAVFRMSLADE